MVLKNIKKIDINKNNIIIIYFMIYIILYSIEAYYIFFKNFLHNHIHLDLPRSYCYKGLSRNNIFLLVQSNVVKSNMFQHSHTV